MNAGWNLLNPGVAVTTSANTLLTTNFYSTSKPTSTAFAEYIVDFGRFLEPEPEPTLYDMGVVLGANLAAATAFLLLF